MLLFPPGEYYGHALYDSEPTIIHHYHNDPAFAYPDFAGGVLFSFQLLNGVVARMKEEKMTRDFTIDSKHELAMLLWNKGSGVSLQPRNDLFCTLPEQTESGACLTRYSPPPPCAPATDIDRIFFAVKTYSGHHKDRVVVVKRTWAHDVRHIEYYSDTTDNYIPTVDLGVPNTERGHCEKSIRILRRFAKSPEKLATADWLVIGDDDTLFSVPRLRQLLACYDPAEPIVLGERYGYGFNADGEYGYEYPTGGPGMVFSRAAVDVLVKECSCPSIDSPDDMVIGMCLRRLNLPLLHSDAFHQARPEDYSEDYLNRIPPISFHKHWMTDPYKIYVERLKVQPTGSFHKERVEDDASRDEL